MGISGLSQFVQAHSSIGTRVDWNPSTTIKDRFFFDGNAFAHQLRQDWLHGGNYAKIAQIVTETIAQLKVAGIEPVFLFDGALPEDKISTRKNRKNNSIKSCTLVMTQLDQINRGLVYVDPSLFLISPWTLEVVIQILRDLQVRLQVCDFEADGELVRLAEKENGYVVSKDSDMFVYPRIGKGYIPLDSLRVNKPVTAQVFHPDRLARLLKLDTGDLPLLGALMGNDYMEKKIWRSVIEDWNFQRGMIKRQWPMTVAEFINQQKNGQLIQNIVRFAPSKKRPELESGLLNAIDKYNIESMSDKTTVCEGLSRLLTDVIMNQTLWTGIFLEDIRKESSWNISQELRQAIYEIQREKLQLEEYKVTEYIRTKQHLDAVKISSRKRTGEDWDWFTELHYSKNITNLSEKPSGLCYLILCLRYMIHQCSSKVEPLADHEVIAITLSTLRCLAPCLGFEESRTPQLEETPALSRRSIHLSAQYQAVVHSSYLLSQMLDIQIQAPLVHLYNGPYFHYCLERTRDGDSLGSLLSDTSSEFKTLFTYAYKLITQDMNIQRVFDYTMDTLSNEKPKRIITQKKTTPPAKKSKLTLSNNPFDLLDIV